MKHADIDCLPACYHMQMVRAQNYSKKSIDARKKVPIIGHGSNYSFFTGYKLASRKLLLGECTGTA